MDDRQTVFFRLSSDVSLGGTNIIDGQFLKDKKQYLKDENIELLKFLKEKI